jgi:hypothetical protein
MASSRFYFGIFLKGLRKNTQTSVGIARVPAEIRMKDLASARLERYL